jgi:hypothetical protein
MTTATKPTDNASATERQLEAALAKAQAEVTRTKQRAYDHRKQIEEVQGRLLERATTHPGEFGETGLPRPKTPADKIAAEAKKLIDQDNFAALIVAAERRVEIAEEALRRHRADRTRDLLVELEPEAREAVDRWMAWAAEGEAIFRELVRIASRSTHLVVPTRLYGGDSRIVPDFQHQQHVLKLANMMPPLPLPGPFVEEREAEQVGEASNE